MRTWIVVLLAVTAFAGCSDKADDRPEGPEAPDPGITRVQDRHLLPFETNATNQPWSLTLEPGRWEILPGIGQRITFDMPLGAGLPTAEVHMGLFFPDNGCDWEDRLGIDAADEAQMLPYPQGAGGDPCRLPVVSDIGPYYGQEDPTGILTFDPHATEPAGRLGRFLIENLVPHGYIIAQVSVTGTGDSTGCMDLMGPVEQAGVQAAVRYLGDAAFSNGAVGLIGRSYDGSTPWEAAMADDLPQLKTVVPISGLYGQLDLMWRNGTAEFRGPGVLWGLYYAFTYTGNDPYTDPDHFDPQLKARQIIENSLCPDTQTGGAQAAAAYIYGSNPDPTEGGGYWAERSFKEEVLQNYEGSVYFIHGMQDWNVDPHMAFPMFNELQAKGLDVKGLFGQWGHHYPDRVSEHPDNLRWDWAQDLLEWFDHYLKGVGGQPQLHVEMQDDRNRWRVEETWPPVDMAWHHIGMDTMQQTAGDGERIYGEYDPVAGTMRGPSNTLRYDVGPIANEEVLLSGLARFHVKVVPDGPGGQVYAELRDKDAGKRLGHAIMDLRYYQGGQTVQTVVPQMAITAMMEFFPMDAVVPAGNALELVIATSGRDYMPSAVNTPVTIVSDGDSVLKLPVLHRDADDLFTPPGYGPA